MAPRWRRGPIGFGMEIWCIAAGRANICHQFFQMPEKMANRVHEPRNSSTVMKSTKALYRMNIRKKLIHEDIVAERSKAQD